MRLLVHAVEYRDRRNRRPSSVTSRTSADVSTSDQTRSMLRVGLRLLRAFHIYSILNRPTSVAVGRIYAPCACDTAEYFS